MNPEEISKTIDDYHKLEKLAINAIKRINDDDAYGLTINMIEKYSLLDIDYKYFSRGYSYDDNLLIPVKLLDASDEEIEEFKETYLKSKTVHGIMKLLSVKTQKPIEELYEMFCWPLYKKFGHAYIAFKQALK